MCVVVAAHKENLDWLRELAYPKIIYKRYVHNGPHVTPNVFHEHAVYLRYICAFYDVLPPLTAFLHGHHTSWHNRASPAARCLPRGPRS